MLKNYMREQEVVVSEIYNKLEFKATIKSVDEVKDLIIEKYALS